MFSKHEVIIEHGYEKIETLLCHEQVVEKRLSGFIDYLKSLETLTILPSILICHKTNVIIDGHHRYHALKKLGFEYCPITKVKYFHANIVPHIDRLITKEAIIDAGVKKKLLPPKSSYHHFIDMKGNFRPLILLSFLSDMCEVLQYAE